MKVENYRLVSTEEYYRLRSMARRNEQAILKRRTACAFKIAAMIMVIIAICVAVGAACYIMYAGSAAGREFEELLVHAMMEMILCVAPSMLIAKELANKGVIEYEDTETEDYDTDTVDLA